MRRFLLLAASFAALLAASGSPAVAARCNDHWNLHPGSCGQRVNDLQWLLAGHRPNVFNKVKPTFKFDPNGAYGARTKAAVRAYKYRIGYPTPISDQVGPYFFALLKGKVQRPASWVANAARRVKAVVPGATPLALRIKQIEVSQLGAAETSYNRGPVVDAYQRYFGVLGLAWCVIFQQWAFAHAGYAPPFADRSFGVFYVVDWARHRGYLNAKPKVGSLVAFLNGLGHMAYVVKVTASGYVTIAGNESNRVNETYHAFSDRARVFIYLPKVATP